MEVSVFETQKADVSIFILQLIHAQTTLVRMAEPAK